MKKILAKMRCVLGNLVRKVTTVVMETIHDADGKISLAGVAKGAALSVLAVGAIVVGCYLMYKVLIALAGIAFVGWVVYTLYREDFPPPPPTPSLTQVYRHYMECEPYIRNAIFQAAYELRRSGALLDIVVTRETDLCIQIVNLGNKTVYQLTVHRRDCSEMGQENSHRVKMWMQQKLISLLASGEVIGANSVTSPYDCNLPLLVVTDAKVYESYYELFVVMTDTPAEYQYGRATYMRRKVINQHTQDPQDPLM